MKPTNESIETVPDTFSSPEHLQSTGTADNTVVVYLSDNGPNGPRFNGGMRGQKGSTFEGGLRSPCVIRYPNHIAPGTVVKSIGGAIDLLPTLTEFAKIDWTTQQLPDKPVDGVSLVNQLTGQSQAKSDETRLLFSHWRKSSTVRTERYRYHDNGSLFDIASDRGETHDLRNDQPQIAERLARQLDQWNASWTDDLVKQPRPFPLAHPTAIWTQLPARDAVFSGTIERSNRFPNCTYLTNWIDTDSEITWEVDVLSSGRYEVELYYACPQTDIGSTIELSIGSETISATIARPVESPLIGATEDRLPRQEGYVLSWQPMTLGTMELTPGRATLRLKATDVVGSQVAEMRLLMFRQLD